MPGAGRVPVRGAELLAGLKTCYLELKSTILGAAHLAAQRVGDRALTGGDADAGREDCWSAEGDGRRV